MTKEGVKMIRSRLTNDIFRDEMYTLYQKRDVSYKDLVSAARRSMRELIEKMRTGFGGKSKAVLQRGGKMGLRNGRY